MITLDFIFYHGKHCEEGPSQDSPFFAFDNEFAFDGEPHGSVYL